ncbi:MAG TPA: hypothetical protein VI703_08610 [Anaerolineales bacterium]|jgi:hypothetical protein|nr:hypothetical protein [Anaerolineales bacterium]
MDAKTITGITQQIYRQFPEVAGEAPSVKAQAGAKSPGDSPTYLITFKGRVSQGGGPTFSRTVRVVANDEGRVLKVTTSR